MTRTIHITSEEELPQVAEAILAAMNNRTVVVFRGEMGARSEERRGGKECY